MLPEVERRRRQDAVLKGHRVNTFDYRITETFLLNVI